MKRKLFLLFFVLLVIVSICRADFLLWNKTSDELFRVDNETGNVTINGWYQGLFDLKVGGSSATYLSINGSHITLNDTELKKENNYGYNGTHWLGFKSSPTGILQMDVTSIEDVSDTNCTATDSCPNIAYWGDVPTCTGTDKLISSDGVSFACDTDASTTYNNASFDLSQIPNTGNVDLMNYNLTNISYLGIGMTPSEELTVNGTAKLYPKNPILVGSVGGTTQPYAVYVSGEFAYVVDSDTDSMLVFDVSVPTAPVLIGSAGGLDVPQDIYVSGRYAYVTDSGTDQLHIFDVSEPANPKAMGVLGGITSGRAIGVSGKYAYVADADTNKFHVFDVSDPLVPTEIGNVSGLQTPVDMHVVGKFAYVTDYNTEKIHIFNISDPRNPTETGSVGTIDDPGGLFVSGKYAYAADDDDNLFHIFNISDPTAPTEIVNIGGVSMPQDIYVTGRYAYVADQGTDSILVFDVVDPTAPVLIGSVGGLQSPRGFFISGRYAYVVDADTNSLLIFDISGFEAPSAMIHSLETGDLQVRNNIIVQGQLQVTSGITVGAGGMLVDGDISINKGALNTMDGITIIPPNTTTKICDLLTEGGIYYDATTNKHRGCDGTNWNDFY